MSTTALPRLLRQDATVISLVGLAHGTSHFYHLMLPPLFPWLMNEYSLSFTQVGALMTVFYVVSAIGQVFAGFLVDRWDAHRVLCVGIALLACSGILVALSMGVGGLYLAAFIAGIGNSVFHPADFALLNHRVSQVRLGHGFSIHGLSGNIGWALAPMFMTTAAASFGWRMAGFAAALVGALSLSALWWKRAELSDGLGSEPLPYEEHRPRGRTLGLQGLLQLPLIWFAFSFFFLSILAFGALQNFAPSLLGNLYGLSLAAATSALSAYLVGGVSGLALGGFLAGSSRGQEWIVGFSFTGAAMLSLLLASAVAPGWAVIGIMAAMGFGIGTVSPSRDMLVRKAAASCLGTGAFGRIYGLVYSGFDVGLAAAPLIFGMLMDAGRPQLVFVGITFSLLLAVVAAQGIAREMKNGV